MAGKRRKQWTRIILALALAAVLCACGSAQTGVPAETAEPADSFYVTGDHVTDSPEWLLALPSAQDESVTQLFVVGGMAMDRTTATISMHQRDADGNWKQIFSTPGFVGKNGLCADADHAEGCGQTPIGIYHFNKAFGIAPDPGCALPYTQVDENTYWSGDMNEEFRDVYQYYTTRIQKPLKGKQAIIAVGCKLIRSILRAFDQGHGL